MSLATPATAILLLKLVIEFMRAKGIARPAASRASKAKHGVDSKRLDDCIVDWPAKPKKLTLFSSELRLGA